MDQDESVAINLQAQEEFLRRVGILTRSLHENLRGLGLDQLLSHVAQDIPDARDRLSYIARLSEESAQKVLTSTECALPLQDKIAEGAEKLTEEWQPFLTQFKKGNSELALLEKTLDYLSQTQQNVVQTRSQLMAIMMAQDFQDLTGQVIKRVTEITQALEGQLIQLLVDYAPSDVKRDISTSLVNGPQINPSASKDVVANQEQVDDLLDSLGF